MDGMNNVNYREIIDIPYEYKWEFTVYNYKNVDIMERFDIGKKIRMISFSCGNIECDPIIWIARKALIHLPHLPYLLYGLGNYGSIYFSLTNNDTTALFKSPKQGLLCIFYEE